MLYNESVFKWIWSSSDQKECIVLGHAYLLINEDGRFKILGKKHEKIIKTLKMMGRKDILADFLI